VSAYDGFAAVYDAWSAHMTEDVDFYLDFYLERAAEADGPVVELGVGTGRVAIPIAERTGKRLVGIDSSSAMLAVARERGAAADVDLDLREEDMRDFALEEPAALVISPFRSLLFLPTWHDRRHVFERVAGSLRPGGRFAWNAFVFDFRIAAEYNGIWREQNGIVHRADHVPADSRMDITLEAGPRISVWWVSRGEWEALIEVAGLEVEALYGWFDRRAFDEQSREFVWVCL
jgi:SAM-dependent methyltransferase